MLTSAYQPLSAVLLSSDVHAAIVSESGRRKGFGHGFTYSAHPVAAAVAREVLAIYRERDIIGHVSRVTPGFQRQLQQAGQHPAVREARGQGLIGGLEMREPANAARLQSAAQAEGLFVRAVGGDVLAICPPLIITEAEISELFERLGRAMAFLG